MKTLVVAMVIVGGLAAWIPAAGAEEYSAATFGQNLRERAETYPADTARTNVQRQGFAAVTSGDQSDVQSDLTITEKSRKPLAADKELSTTAHNGRIITGNFQAVYDNMSDAEKKTAGPVFRRHINTAGLTK